MSVLPTFDKHIEYQFYFKQKVNRLHLQNAFRGATNLTRVNKVDHFAQGFSTTFNVVENDPTPDFTIDVEGPARGDDDQGDRIQWDTTQDVDCGTDEDTNPVTLPSAGNEKWISVFVGYDEALSDPQIDGNGATIQYQVDDAVAFTVIQGTEAAIGSAVRPSIPTDSRMLICDILLGETTTTIVNSMIYTNRRLKSFPHGTTETTFLTGLHLQGDPAPNQVQKYMFNRGDRPPAGMRVIEGADPSTDPPTVQVTKFTDTDTFSWVEDVDDQVASEVPTSTGAFNQHLSGTDTDVQTALETLDDHVHDGDDVFLDETQFSSNLSSLGPSSTTQDAMEVIDALTLGTDDQNASEVPVNVSAFDAFLASFNPGTPSVQDILDYIDDNAGSGGNGEITKVQFFETDAPFQVGGNEYADLATTPEDPDTVRVFMVDGPAMENAGSGLAAPHGFDVITDGVSLKRISWTGPLTMRDNLSETGIRFMVVYTINTTTQADAVNVQTTAFTNNLLGATEVQAALDLIDTGGFGGAAKLATITGIDATATGVTPLFTVPAGKEVVLTKVVYRLTAVAAITGTLNAGIGINAGEDDIFNPEDFTGLDNTDEAWVQEQYGRVRKGVATDSIDLGIDVAFSGTTATLAVDIFGYMFPAQ